MFDFLGVGMMGSYEDRKVARWESPENPDFFISTARVTDSEYPYETAVKHPDYNGGVIVIVANYNNREEAEAGHERVVTAMTVEPLPDKLVDVSEARIAQLGKAIADQLDEPWGVYPRQKR